MFQNKLNRIDLTTFCLGSSTSFFDMTVVLSKMSHRSLNELFSTMCATNQ